MARDVIEQNDKAPRPRPPLVSGHTVSAIIPQDFDACYRLAQVVIAAQMAPKSIDSVEKATIAIMHGLEVGLTPMAALQSIAVINGMPTIWGDGMLALIRASGLLEEIIEEVEVDAAGEPTIATCKVKRRGEESWAISTFTRPEAQRAGLWNKAGPWQGYRPRMMKMRARSWALRDKFSDVLRGLHMAEEAQDMIDITPRGSVTIPPEPRRSDADSATVEAGAAAVSDRPVADAGSAAALDGHPASPPASGEPSPSPEPSAEANGADGGPAAAGTSTASHSPPERAQSSPDLSMPKNWTVGADVLGQDAIIRRLMELLELARSADDIDEIEKQNAERLAKITGNRRANLNVAFRAKRETFAP